MGLTGSKLKQEYQIIEAAKKDRRHFKLLYEKYYQQLFLFALKRLSSEDLAADITQQAFIKAMVNLPKYKNMGLPFSSWLYRITLNEINLFYRNKSKRRVVELNEQDLSIIQEELEQDDYEHNIQAMVKSFNILAEGELLMIEMKYFEKRSFKEIGEILGIKEGNAKVKLHRILKRLKKHILGGGKH